MKKIIKFLFRSSADPRQVSLTLKMALLGAVPYLMQSLGLVCGLGHFCVDVDPNLVEHIIDVFTQAIFYFLSFVSTLGVLYGAYRKVRRTLRGENLAIK